MLPRLADSPVRVPAGQRRCYFPQARRREWTYHSCHPGGGHGDYFDPHRRHTGFLYNNETGAVKCPGVADFYADTYQEARSLLRLLGKDPGGGLRLTPACIVAGMSDDLARYAPPDIPLRLTRTGPGSRADMIEYVRTVIEQRTAVNDDTSADRLARGLVTSILSRLGAGYSIASGAATIALVPARQADDLPDA